MNISHLLFVFLCVHGAVLAQTNRFQNEGFIRKLYADTSYQRLKEKISSEFTHAQPGHWGEFVKGVDEDLVTNQKIIALTFDACGGPHSSGFDLPLINYLKQQNVPALTSVTWNPFFESPTTQYLFPFINNYTFSPFKETMIGRPLPLSPKISYDQYYEKTPAARGGHLVSKRSRSIQPSTADWRGESQVQDASGTR